MLLQENRFSFISAAAKEKYMCVRGGVKSAKSTISFHFLLSLDTHGKSETKKKKNKHDEQKGDTLV